MTKMKRLYPGGRLPRATHYRYQALRLLAREGVLELEGFCPHLTYRCADFSISHCAPFAAGFGLENRADLAPRLFSAPSLFDHKYLLDAHDRTRKVLSIQWDPDDRAIALINFRRGEWELALCELMGCEDHAPSLQPFSV